MILHDHSPHLFGRIDFCARVPVLGLCHLPFGPFARPPCSQTLDLQNFVDFGFSGVSLKVLFISLLVPVTTKLFFTQLFSWNTRERSGVD